MDQDGTGSEFQERCFLLNNVSLSARNSVMVLKKLHLINVTLLLLS